ncbi:YceI family protein [Bacteroidota bacterium]
MKKNITLVIFALLLTNLSFGQKYLTKNGHISFFSDSPAEKIEANNHQVNAALDLQTGDFVFKVLMKSFEFEKALMQEHFNENYVESDKFPNATFIGKIDNLKSFDLTKTGKYEVNISGKLTIHGVTQDVSVKGTLEVVNGLIKGSAIFNVKLSDYNIKIPKAVVNNIAELVEIKVMVDLSEYKK